jgi:replicative DNA helicase
MEEEFRAQLSEQGYIHEILAEFGSQETGVFDKDKLDKAMKQVMYAYMPLTYSQQHAVEENGWKVDMMIPPAGMNIGTYRPNVFRTMGVNLSRSPMQECIENKAENCWKESQQPAA